MELQGAPKPFPSGPSHGILGPGTKNQGRMRRFRPFSLRAKLLQLEGWDLELLLQALGLPTWKVPMSCDWVEVGFWQWWSGSFPASLGLASWKSSIFFAVVCQECQWGTSGDDLRGLATVGGLR